MAACRPTVPPAQQALLISGAAAMLPLAGALADAFVAGRSDLTMLVAQGGSLPAYIAACRGAIDLAAMTRALSDSEDGAGVHHYLVARDFINVVVHPDLPMHDLTPAQAQAALAGRIRNWRALGGPDRAITVYVAPRGTLARQSAEQVLLAGGDFAVGARACASDAALLAAVATDPGAIGCIAGHAGDDPAGMTALAIGGVRAAPATVLSGRYPCTQGFYLMLHGEPAGARGAFVQFARSAAGQAIVAGHGLLPVC